MKSILKRIRQSTFFIKWTQWEYYPIYIVNIPTVFIWLYFGIRARNLFFFSTVNPALETGGMLGASKWNILQSIPLAVIPKTILISDKDIAPQAVLNQIQAAQLDYPLIAKPNVGERGLLVEKLENDVDLAQYIQQTKVDFLVQEYVSYPLEVSILFHQMPESNQGDITSICIKKNLSVIGDGVSTIESLMEYYPRARFQLARFRKNYPDLLEKIPSKGQQIELEPIGNHSRGTTFLDGNKYKSPQLVAVFNQLMTQMDSIYYGRFDIKCESLALLEKGKAFKVLEFNGVASEPAHIYDPSYSVIQAYQDFYQHWHIMYRISQIQRRKGIKPLTWSEATHSIRQYFRHLKVAKSEG